MARFENVSCSQCGKDFGPGDNGFSHCQNHGKGKIIKLNHICPPIPIRQFDWSATLEGYEPGDPIGYGETRAEAIRDLCQLL